MDVNKETLDKAKDKKYNKLREDIFEALSRKALKAINEKKVFIANEMVEQVKKG